LRRVRSAAFEYYEPAGQTKDTTIKAGAGYTFQAGKHGDEVRLLPAGKKIRVQSHLAVMAIRYNSGR